MGYISKYTCLVQSIDLCILRDACHELFASLGIFLCQGRGTRDAGRRGNKVTLIHIKDASKILSRLFCLKEHFNQYNSDFKIRWRRRQQERQKNNRFYKQNNNFAPASHLFVHFFSRFCMPTMWKCLILCFMENINKQRQNLISLSELGYGPQEFNSRRVRLHLTKKVGTKK